MCMMLYIAADKPLPLIPWDENSPLFNVTALQEYSEAVRKQFSKPFIFYLGAHTGCSCGFSYGQYIKDDAVPEELRELEEKNSVQSLLAYLTDAVKLTGSLELYSCWNGDEEGPADLRETIYFDELPQKIGGKSFCFQEGEFIEITQSQPAHVPQTRQT